MIATGTRTRDFGDVLRCAECGRRIVRRRSADGFVHASRGPVAACDLDADHPAVPERGADDRADPPPPSG